VPSGGFDARAVGVAFREKSGQFSLCVENQSPYLNCVSTTAHEMTHIWQYLNWDDKHLKKTYYERIKEIFPDYDPALILYEGMAKWTEVQYLYSVNEQEKAAYTIHTTLNRDDEYGLGFLLYFKEYGFSKTTIPTNRTPFMDPSYPLHDIIGKA